MFLDGLEHLHDPYSIQNEITREKNQNFPKGRSAAAGNLVVRRPDRSESGHGRKKNAKHNSACKIDEKVRFGQLSASRAFFDQKFYNPTNF